MFYNLIVCVVVAKFLLSGGNSLPVLPSLIIVLLE